VAVAGFFRSIKYGSQQDSKTMPLPHGHKSLMKSPPKSTGKTKALFQQCENNNTLQKGLSDRNAKKEHWHLA